MEVLLYAAVPYLIIFFFMWLFKSEEVYKKSFWWDTWNGINYSTSILYKYKRLPFYFIEHKVKYKHPKEHPEYVDFLLAAEQIKNKRSK